MLVLDSSYVIRPRAASLSLSSPRAKKAMFHGVPIPGGRINLKHLSVLPMV